MRSENRAPAGANHWPRTAGYFALFVNLGLVTSALGPTLPALAGQAGVDLDQASILFTAHALGYLLGALLGGRLYDLMGGHPVQAAGLALMALSIGLVPLVPSLWPLAVLWLLVGLAGGALDVGGNTLMVWVHGREVGPYMNGLHFFFGVGSALGPLVVALMLALGTSAARAYWPLALLLLPVAAWLLRLASPAAPGDEDPDDAVPGPAATSNAARAPSRGGAPAGAIVALIAALLLLYVGAEVAFGGWVYSYAVALDLGSAEGAAYLASAFWGALTAGRLLAIPVAARYRPRTILLVDLLGCLLSVAIILLWSGSAVALWAGSLGLGASMASIFPTAITLAERRLRITGRVTGWFLAGSSVGAMSLPWIIGQLFTSVGPTATMSVILFDLAAALGVFGVLMWVSRAPSNVPAQAE
jgi:MFS transporter, FHS family, Na+ dependent glucose transporter 1